MMTNPLKLVVAQFDACVGDITGNLEKIVSRCQQAKHDWNADGILFPELALCGYPPEDLIFHKGFHAKIHQALNDLTQFTDIDILIGAPHITPEGIYNAAFFIANGKIQSIYHKQQLPNYGVFDEKRYFKAGHDSCVIDWKGIKTGILICEDLWFEGPARAAVEQGAQLIITLNASPFEMRKMQQREDLLRFNTTRLQTPIIYVQTVGGQDELVFDGGSLVMDGNGHICQRAPFFQEILMPVQVDKHNLAILPPHTVSPNLSIEEHVYQALKLGLTDYIQKNGFKGVVLGLSGGIDSAMTLAIAVDALGKEAVEVVLMPSRYTSNISIEDALEMAEHLGVKHTTLSIEPAFCAFLDSLADEFQEYPADTTEQNIQARCRGILLMAISNKKGSLLLTTGNKSEMAVGYATLYGDMAGGFSLLKDVPKTLVYQLAHFRNSLEPIIPQRIIDRAPSAELAPHQKDEDSLPPYPLLDAIIEEYIERDQDYASIVAKGYPAPTVRKVLAMIDRNEYKRRQAPPGIRITRCAFGRERRYPITSRFFHGENDNEEN